MSSPGNGSTSGMLASMTSGSSSSTRKSSEAYQTLTGGVSPLGSSNADKANFGKTVGRGFGRPKFGDEETPETQDSNDDGPRSPSYKSDQPLLQQDSKKTECCVPPCCIL